MRLLEIEDFVGVDAEGRIEARPLSSLSYSPTGTSPVSADLTINDGPSELQTPGSLSGTEFGDVIALTLTAGVTYSFTMRPTATGGIEDPMLGLFDASFNQLTLDDDGGAGRSALLTFTPTTSGTYYLYATSFLIQDSGNPADDVGDYTIDFWTADPATDAPGSLAGAVQIHEGETTFGHIAAASDVDVYAIDLTQGQYYTFSYSGGVAGSGEFGEPGGSVATVELLDAAGNVVASNVNFESGVGFFAQDGGSYYVRLTSYQNTTGGYTLDVSSVNLAEEDPLEAIIWDSAANVPFVDTDADGVGDTVYVYFAAAGENFGQLQGEPGSTEELISLGWNDYEMGQVMLMLEQYEHILGVNYEITTDADQAAFRLITTEDEPYGARFFPQDADAYGDAMGIGIFNTDSHAWTFDANGPAPGAQQSLEQGGFAFELLLHEFGHAHGLAHPHDTGGGSEIMIGVTASQGSFGVYNLNQSVYSVMSYNSTWHFSPDGPTPFAVSSVDSGSVGTLSPFDIAALQQRYGVVERNLGDNIYALTDVQDDAMYQTIWDSGGTDVISYSGALNAQIDLTAATLDYTPTGGGVISFLFNPPGLPNSQIVRGGYLIANGVLIENAIGGSGNDMLLGNAAANILDGNNGNDVLMGRLGDDTLNGGAGSDTAAYNDAAGAVSVNLATQSATGADGGDTYTSVENATGSKFNDSLVGDGNANILDGGDGNDLLDGAGGIDTASYASVSGGVTVDLRIQGAAQNTVGGGIDTLNSTENLTGSRFDDRLIGNDDVNVIKGGNGLDVVTLGGGNDRFVAEIGALKVGLKTGTMSLDIITDFDQSGNDFIDLSGLGQAFSFKGTKANKSDGDLTYKTYTSVNGAENALGFDIDGQPGAGVSGPVTVVYGNVDGGGADFAIVLLNTSSVAADDFIFGATSSSSAVALSSMENQFGGPAGNWQGTNHSAMHADYFI